MRCSAILIKLLDKFSRITTNDFAQNTSPLTQSLGEKISRKRASPRISGASPKNIQKMRSRKSFLSESWVEKVALHSMW